VSYVAAHISASCSNAPAKSYAPAWTAPAWIKIYLSPPISF